MDQYEISKDSPWIKWFLFLIHLPVIRSAFEKDHRGDYECFQSLCSLLRAMLFTIACLILAFFSFITMLMNYDTCLVVLLQEQSEQYFTVFSVALRDALILFALFFILKSLSLKAFDYTVLRYKGYKETKEAIKGAPLANLDSQEEAPETPSRLNILYQGVIDRHNKICRRVKITK